MSGGFVKLPNEFLDDASLPDRAVRLWACVRQRNGETDCKGCYESAISLNGRMCAHGRRLLPNQHNGGAKGQHISSAFKRAQRALVDRGLLLVLRRGPGQTALRWALSPGADGELELGELLKRGVIGEQEFQATRARQSDYLPRHGT